MADPIDIWRDQRGADSGPMDRCVRCQMPMVAHAVVQAATVHPVTLRPDRPIQVLLCPGATFTALTAEVNLAVTHGDPPIWQPPPLKARRWPWPDAFRLLVSMVVLASLIVLALLSLPR